MGIQVDVLRINGFRGIQNLEITLPKVMILFGQNNAGKTSIIKALQLVLGDYGRYLSSEDFFINSDNDQQIDKITVDIRIIPIDENGRVKTFEDDWVNVFGEIIQPDLDEYDYVALRAIAKQHETLQGKYITEREYLTEWNDFDNWLDSDTLKLTKKLDEITFIPIDAQRDIHSEIKEKYSFIGRVLSNINYSSSEIEELEEKIAEINQNAVDKSANLTHLKTHLDKLSETTLGRGKTEIMPFPKKIRDLSKNFSLHFGDNANSSFSMEYHGMGTRSWASMLTVKAFTEMLRDSFEKESKPFFSLIAAEEPEAHLHPNAQRTLYNQLASMENQVIVSTHSPYLISMADFSQLRALYKKDGRVASYKLTENLNQGEKNTLKRAVLFSRGELMFSRVLVLAEGVTEEQVLPSLIQAYFGQSCSALGINCIGVGGVNYAPFIKMAVSFGIPVVVISDNESNINTKVNKVIANIIDKFNLVLSSDVFYLQFLQPNNNFESELLGLYLRNEIIDALMLAYKEKDSDEIHRQIKEQELNSSSNEQLFKEMKSSKSTYSGFLADIILENPYNKDFKTLLSLPLNNAFEKIAEWIK
jgi:putative ATP-dependent endonuclease of OLD family